MMKTMSLVCAAMLTFTASGFGMQKAGWFGSRTGRGADIRQVQCSDPFQSDAAMRYRHNQNTNWRLVMSIR